MPLRQIDCYLSGETELPSDLIEDAPWVDRWTSSEEAGGRVEHLLVELEKSEAILDRLESALGSEDRYRIVLLEAQATLPRVEEEEEASEEHSEVAAEEDEEDSDEVDRISREELHQDLSDTAQVDLVYALLVVLSTVVAAGGMISGSTAVVIGAMVIAPLLGPCMALALASTLADGSLARRAGKAHVVGMGLAFAVSLVLGLVLGVDSETPGVVARTELTLGDVALGLAAGVAGALSFTRGLASAVVGVMVAVALLPPLVAGGMMLGVGAVEVARGGLLLAATNFIAINLAGVVTFAAQGIRPHRWWEVEEARRFTHWALVIWTVLLALLVAAIIWT